MSLAHRRIICDSRTYWQQQAANILFAICGIVGSLYGIGQTFEELDPMNIHKALFVSGRLNTLRGSSESLLTLTGHKTVVVARSNVLCYYLRRCESIHRASPPSPHGCQVTFPHSLGGHRPIDCGGTGLLVHVDPTMHTSLVLLGEDW